MESLIAIDVHQRVTVAGAVIVGKAADARKAGNARHRVVFSVLHGGDFPGVLRAHQRGQIKDVLFPAFRKERNRQRLSVESDIFQIRIAAQIQRRKPVVGAIQLCQRSAAAHIQSAELIAPAIQGDEFRISAHIQLRQLIL